MINSQAAQWLLEDHPKVSVADFWRHVDTEARLPFWAVDPEWVECRGTDCMAAMGDGRRCTAITKAAPFCERHLEKARRWFRMLDLRDEVSDACRMPMHELASTIVTAQLIIESHMDDLVYFWEIRGAGVVKIGHSNRPNLRTADFLKGRGCTFPPDVDPSQGHLLGTTPGGRTLEAALHQKYRYARVVGEWFRLDERLATEIDSFVRPALAAS